METFEHILAGLSVFLLVSTPISHGMMRAAEKFYEYALTTPSEKDDRLGATLLYWAEKLSKGLSFMGRFLPVITRGGKVQ